MDIQKILAELRKEREQIQEAVLSLERMARGGGKRRTRLPFWALRKRSGDPDDGSGGTSGEGCTGAPSPLTPRHPRKPPMASKLPLPE